MEILNDRIVAEGLLEQGFTYKKCFFFQLESLVRYLAQKGKSKEETLDTCVKILKEYDTKGTHYSDIIEVDNENGILQKLYESSLKKAYLDDTTIYFSKEEMESIDELASIRAQRMLFTVICLLKFRKDILGKTCSFITNTNAEILRMAGVSLPSNERRSLWKEIVDSGKIEIFVTQRGEDVCYRPLLPRVEGQEYNIAVSTAIPFGEQWLTLMRKDMYQCEDCGGWFKRKNLKNIKRCPECNKKHRRKYLATKVREFRKREKEKNGI